MGEFGLHDSGYRREFGTGAVRDTDDGKSRPDALSPYALERFGQHMAKGFLKYGEFNFEKGIPVSQLVASLERHLNAFKRGLREEDHLSAMLFNVQAIAHFEQLSKLGDATALAMLDRYASKHLADEIRSEVGAMLEADSYVGTMEDLNAQVQPSKLLPNPDWVGREMRVTRDVTVAEYDVVGNSGASTFQTVWIDAGTVLMIEAIKGEVYQAVGRHGTQPDWHYYHVKPEWLELVTEPESLVGCTVRVTRDVSKNDYFDDQVMRDGYHLYKDQTLEVIALKDDGLYICKGTKYNPYFNRAVEELGWQFEHVKPEWVKTI